MKRRKGVVVILGTGLGNYIRLGLLERENKTRRLLSHLKEEWSLLLVRTTWCMIIADVNLTYCSRVWMEEDSDARGKNKCYEGIGFRVPVCSDGDVVMSDGRECGLRGKVGDVCLGILISVSGGGSWFFESGVK
jgi:hypothetical protein